MLLPGDIDTGQRRGNLITDMGNGFPDRLPSIAVTAIPNLDSLQGAGRRSRWDDRPTEGSSGREHLGFDRRIASRIEDLAGMNSLDLGVGHLGLA